MPRSMLALLLVFAVGGLTGAIVTWAVVGADPTIGAAAQPMGRSIPSQSPGTPLTSGLAAAPSARMQAPAEIELPLVTLDDAERLLAEVQLDRASGGEGAGALRGRIVTDLGVALPGVTVVADGSAAQQAHRGTDPSTIGAGEPPVESLLESVRALAQRHGLQRTLRRRVESDADGQFLFERLPDGYLWKVQGFEQDWEIRAVAGLNPARLHEPIALVARPIITARVRVELPGGTLAESATLHWRGGSRGGSQAWSPSHPVLRVAPGGYTVSAKAGVTLPGGPGRERGMRSAESQVNLSATEETSIVLRLEARHAVVGWLYPAANALEGQNYEIHLARIGPGGPGGLDPDAFPVGVKQRIYRLGQGYRFLDVQPGAYILYARSRGANTILAQERIEVVQGILEIDLHADPYDIENLLRVSIHGPDGSPVTDGFSFVLTAQGKRGHQVAVLEPIALLDGAFLLDVTDSKLRYFSGGIEDAVYTLKVSSSYWGRRSLELAPGQAAVTCTLRAPVSLKVTVTGWQGVDADLRVHVSAKPRSGDSRQSAGVTANGTVNISGLESGLHDVSISSYGNQSATNRGVYSGSFGTKVVDVRAGSELSFAFPSLHRLDVRVPEGFEGKAVQARSAAPGRYGTADMRANSDGLARLRGLPAGRYKIQCSGTQAVEVDVPCGEVVLYPR